jgi:hypothetical protein
VLFDLIFSELTVDKIKKVFVKGLTTKRQQQSLIESDSDEGDVGEDKLAEFRRGLSEYLLTKFYLKKKKEGALEKEAGLKEKFKACFDIINKEQEGEFIREAR